MKGSNVDELQLLVNAATDWRNAGLSVGLSITQLNAAFSDGSKIVLTWSDTDNEWHINTVNT